MSNLEKSSPKNRAIIASLDIGTTKVVFAIAGVSDQKLEIIGVGNVENTGMRQGAVVNIDQTAKAIQKAREEAELMAGFEVDSVWMSVGGMNVQSFDSSGMVAISDGEIGESDINRVIEAAKAVVIPTDRQMLHVLPNDFKVDGQGGISDPIGMSGVRLEASVHLVTGNSSALQNAIKCVERVGLTVQGMVLGPLASSMSVISEDEKNLGVTVVDMGGGTCDVISFYQGSVVYTGVIPVGGNNFTHDVAMGLKTSQADAESVKKKWGCALSDLVGDEETITVAGVGGRTSRELPKKNLARVLEARAEETLSLIRAELEKSGYATRMGSGMILTGGACQLNGLSEMGDFIFDVPVRLGLPSDVGGLKEIVKDPGFTTSVGLLKYGWEEIQKTPALAQKFKPEQENSFNFNKIARKIRDLLSGSQ